MINADLHLHSIHSDGTFSVSELLTLVREEQVTLAALTDHDTIDGVGEALSEGRRLGMEIIPAVELAAGFTPAGRDNHTEVHVLAYGIDCLNPALLEMLEWSRSARRERNRSIMARLQLLGLEVDTDSLDLAHGTVGRPHIARQLVASGQASSVQRVFKDYLAEGKPAWRPRRLKPVADVCDTVHTAGGVAVLAHPLKNISFDDLDQVSAAGLDGVETVHPGHNSAGVALLEQYARTVGLFTTGGSDFHGFGPYLRPAFNPAPLQAALNRHRSRLTREDDNAE